MSRETERKHLDGAIAVATEALQHLQRGSVVGVKYHEGGSIDEVGGPAVILFKLEVEALDLPLRSTERKQEKFLPDDPRAGHAMAVPEEIFARGDELHWTMAAAEQTPDPEAAARNATLIRSILMSVFLAATTMSIDRAVKKLLDAQALLK